MHAACKSAICQAKTTVKCPLASQLPKMTGEWRQRSKVKMANIEFRVQYSQRYLFNAIPDTNHNANNNNNNNNRKRPNTAVCHLATCLFQWLLRRWVLWQMRHNFFCQRLAGAQRFVQPIRGKPRFCTSGFLWQFSGLMPYAWPTR